MDEKDRAAMLESLQTNTKSNDPKIEAGRARVEKMLADIFKYMTDAGVKIKKVDNYFPRVWDREAIMKDIAFSQLDWGYTEI